MKVEVNGRLVSVTLSKRNLLALLDKVDNPCSFATLSRKDGEHLLFVHAEPDAMHYRDREPGPMEAGTEGRIGGYAPPTDANGDPMPGAFSEFNKG